MKVYVEKQTTTIEDRLVQEAMAAEQTARATDAVLATTIDDNTFIISKEGYGFRIDKVGNWAPKYWQVSEDLQRRLAAVPWIAERRTRAKAKEILPPEPKPALGATPVNPKVKVEQASPLHTATVDPKIGQIWQDCHTLKTPRYLLLTSVGPTEVQCVTLRTGKTSTIRKDRLKPGSRGYSFVVDPAVLEQIGKQLSGAPKEV